MEQLVQQVLVQLSLFAVGSALVTIGVLLKRRPKRWYGYALAKLGILTIVGVILLLILPPREGLPFDWKTITYATGVAECVAGVTIVCRDILDRTGHKSGIDKVVAALAAPREEEESDGIQ